MKIKPLRDYVVVELLPEEGNESGGLLVVRAAKAAVRQGTVIACGPECRDIQVGSVVLVNLLVASEINGQHLVPEPSILGTL